MPSGALSLPMRHAFRSPWLMLRFGVIAGILLFLALTGLGAWLLPFSALAQWSVLLHTAGGLLIVIPFAVWQLSHWLGSRKARWNSRKVSAYAGFWTLAATAASGLVLAWQALFSLNISHLLDRVHLFAGLAALPFLAVHLWPGPKAIVIPSGSGAARLDLSTGRRRMWRLAALSAALLLVLVAAASIAARGPVFPRRVLPAGFQLPYGPNPFAPSLTSTADGRPLPPQLISESRSCGTAGCHSAIYQEWRASAHHWAAEDLFFQAVQTSMIREAGIPVARYCAGCHDPTSLLSAYKDASTGIEAPGFQEGASCVVCHGMDRVDTQGNGHYLFVPAKPYLFQFDSRPWAAGIAHFLIRAYPRQHDTDYDLALVKQPVSCAACHKQSIGKVINGVGFVQLQNQYDEWRTGRWNNDPNPARRLRCQDCHMYWVSAAGPRANDPYDRSIGLGARHRNHWFAAGNQAMPAMLHAYDASAQTARVNRWLQGKVVIPEIARLWPPGPVISVHVLAPASARPEQQVELRAVVENDKAGHNFATGPLDLIRAWVEIQVTDAAGRVLFHSGALTPQDRIEPGTIVIRSVGINAQGQPILRHDLWHYVGTSFKRSIPPGYSDMYAYAFRLPARVPGPLQVTAWLRYRKANRTFMDYVFPGQPVRAPITTLASATTRILVAGPTAALAFAPPRAPSHGRALRP